MVPTEKRDNKNRTTNYQTAMLRVQSKKQDQLLQTASRPVITTEAGGGSRAPLPIVSCLEFQCRCLVLVVR